MTLFCFISHNLIPPSVFEISSESQHHLVEYPKGQGNGIEAGGGE